MSDLTALETVFVRLVDGPIALTALAVAFAVGAVHALSPGHGKAVTAAYLVGARGTPRDALLLGVVVAAMHTASVLLLGGLLAALQRAPGASGQLTVWLRLAAGLLVVGVGAGLLTRQVRRRLDARRDARSTRRRRPRHRHRNHAHDHDHLHAAVLRRPSLVLLGASGGLLPSPSAFLVLATAIFAGRTWFGLALVAAFSVGLATCLTAVGLLALHGRELVVRGGRTRPGLARLAGMLPLASAAAVLAGGLWVTVVALRALVL